MTAKHTDTPLRVASYNIRKAKGLDQRRDPMRILNVINGLEADIVALQEADRRLGPRHAALSREAIERETDFVVAPLAMNDVSIGWHGNAILVRKGLKINAVARIPLPGLEPRGAVHVSVGGIDILGVHLGLLRSSRQGQLAAPASWVGGHRTTVIMGDFNEWSDVKGLEPLAKDFVLHQPGRTYHAARPVAGLDRIALTHNMQLFDAGVEQGRLARRASDHLPIWADVLAAA